MTLLIFLLLISALVFVHELGHFLLAKRAGIRVDEFAIGFPPRLFSWKRGETTYAINALPIGGYVKIVGEDGEEAESPRSFVRAPKLTQAAVLAAGVAFNWLAAIVAFWLALVIGVQVAPGNPLWDVASDRAAEIQGVVEGSPAAGALEPGDRIELINDVPVLTADDVIAAVAAAGDQVSMLGTDANGERFTLALEPTFSPDLGRNTIGVIIDARGTAKLGVLEAIPAAVSYTAYATKAVAVGLGGIIAEAFRGEAELADVSGPVGIAVLAKGASDMGWGQLLAFAATISINLAIVNLAPLPALDGGRLVVVGIEAVTRRRVPARWLGWVNLAGFALLLALMAAITVSDVGKFF